MDSVREGNRGDRGSIYLSSLATEGAQASPVLDLPTICLETNSGR
jgi:hypothetical protein